MTVALTVAVVLVAVVAVVLVTVATRRRRTMPEPEPQPPPPPRPQLAIRVELFIAAGDQTVGCGHRLDGGAQLVELTARPHPPDLPRTMCDPCFRQLGARYTLIAPPDIGIS